MFKASLLYIESPSWPERHREILCQNPKLKLERRISGLRALAGLPEDGNSVVQYLHGSSQPRETPVPGEFNTLSGLLRHQTCT